MTTFFRFQPKFPGIFKSLSVRARSGGHVTYGGPAAEKDARDNFLIKTQFIDSKEEELLMSEIKKSFRRSKYEYSHWDGVITGYRETEKSNWSDPVCRSVIERLQQVTKSYSTVGTGDTLPLIHVLDLAEDGSVVRVLSSIRTYVHGSIMRIATKLHFIYLATLSNAWRHYVCIAAIVRFKVYS